jgi:hypothetical protein
VTNTDRGSLVRIPIQSDGTAGAPSEIAGPSCADLNGADGLAIAHNGDLIVAVNHQNKLARVDRAGHMATSRSSTRRIRVYSWCGDATAPSSLPSRLPR